MATPNPVSPDSGVYIDDDFMVSTATNRQNATGMHYNRAVRLSDGTILAFDQGQTSSTTMYCWYSTDNGDTWTKCATSLSAYNNSYFAVGPDDQIFCSTYTSAGRVYSIRFSGTNISVQDTEGTVNGYQSWITIHDDPTAGGYDYVLYVKAGGTQLEVVGYTASTGALTQIATPTGSGMGSSWMTPIVDQAYDWNPFYTTSDKAYYIDDCASRNIQVTEFHWSSGTTWASSTTSHTVSGWTNSGSQMHFIDAVYDKSAAIVYVIGYDTDKASGTFITASCAFADLETASQFTAGSEKVDDATYTAGGTANIHRLQYVQPTDVIHVSYVNDPGADAYVLYNTYDCGGDSWGASWTTAATISKSRIGNYFHNGTTPQTQHADGGDWTVGLYLGVQDDVNQEWGVWVNIAEGTLGGAMAGWGIAL